VAIAALVALVGLCAAVAPVRLVGHASALAHHGDRQALVEPSQHVPPSDVHAINLPPPVTMAGVVRARLPRAVTAADVHRPAEGDPAPARSDDVRPAADHATASEEGRRLASIATEPTPELAPLVRSPGFAPLAIPITAPTLAASSLEATRTSPAFWNVAADGGVAVGKTSRKAALATAGFFSRFGKKVATSF
jgi:hypothetical protein